MDNSDQISWFYHHSRHEALVKHDGFICKLSTRLWSNILALSGVLSLGSGQMFYQEFRPEVLVRCFIRSLEIRFWSDVLSGV